MAPRRRKSRMVPQQPDRRANRTILLRTLFLMLVCGVCAFVPLFVKLYQIQIVEHEKYEQLAIDQQTRDSTVSASRGTIYDSKGTPLAMSYTVYNIQLSPRDIVKLQDAYQEAVETAREKGKEAPDYPEPTNQFIAEGLSEILDLDVADIIKRLEKSIPLMRSSNGVWRRRRATRYGSSSPKITCPAAFSLCLPRSGTIPKVPWRPRSSAGSTTTATAKALTAWRPSMRSSWPGRPAGGHRQKREGHRDALPF